MRYLRKRLTCRFCIIIHHIEKNYSYLYRGINTTASMIIYQKAASWDGVEKGIPSGK